MITIQQRIENLQSELNNLKNLQSRCQHRWSEPYQDSEAKQIPITENRPMGSDFFNPVTVGWETVYNPVWRRKCKECGLLQTTTKTEAVIERHRPVF